ncbi:MAG TPA: 1-(5-phosphoribosyl)-5-[(5-phosphoribosylamino)methylideneamino]imidazole-4-carboxamide isomerase [Bacillota bacterium]
MIIIPAIDLLGGNCVRLHQGDPAQETFYDKDPVQVARRWEALGAKRLHLVDLDGAFRGEPTQMSLVQEIIAAVSIPVEVGGGIRCLETVERYLDAGAAWVILGTAAIQSPGLVSEACRKYSGRILAGIDAKNGKVATDGWVNLTAKTALELAIELKQEGIAELIYTDIGRDGTLTGPNTQALTTLAQSSGLAVIASGGISGITDLEQLRDLHLSGITGAIVGKALYDKRIDLAEAIRVIEG